jgi:hypothetical protein
MGILVRSGPLSHPEVAKRIRESFVPVAIEVSNYKPTWDDIDATVSAAAGGRAGSMAPIPPEADVAAFRDIDQQGSMAQGIWITTPDGKLLCNYYGLQPRVLLDSMNAALGEWKLLCQAAPLALPDVQPAAAEATPPVPGQVRLLFFGRLLDGMSRTIFRDSAYFAADLWQNCLPRQPSISDEFGCPNELLELIASRLYPGEMRLVMRREEFTHLSASLHVRQVADGVAVAELHGEVSADGTFPFSDRRRQYEGRLRGELTWRVDPCEVLAFQVISDGAWQAEYPNGRPAAVMDVYPGGRPPGRLEMSQPLRLMFLVEVPAPDRPVQVAQTR